MSTACFFLQRRLCQRIFSSRRWISTEAYAEKLKRRSEETGLSLEELKARAQEQVEQERLATSEALHKNLKPQVVVDAKPSSVAQDASRRPGTRKDEAPVKPLSDILRLSKIMNTSPEQVSALWTAYHASKSEGTGRGYLCAAIPRRLYESMATVGSKYPYFIVPLPRPDPEDPTNTDKISHEFYFMQWDFHYSPAVPSAHEDPFVAATSNCAASPNPKISTVLFTPLQEYKMRNTFATPYLILTHYTDLAHSHDTVLLRGEITPSIAGTSADGRYMLSQEDAQRLPMALQKFYAWGAKDGQGPEGERLLTQFHSKPDQFSWEDLLRFYNMQGP